MSTDNFVKKLKNIAQVFKNQQKRILTMRAFYSDGFETQLNGKKVLEIGAGNGLNACFMAHFGAEVSTQDISPESEKNILELKKHLGFSISPYSGDLRTLGFNSGSFDLVVGKSIIHHLTHELEEGYFSKMVQLLKEDGAVRFVEPAQNLPVLRQLLLMLPLQGRPSSLQRTKYKKYQDHHPHPVRDNSTAHYLTIGKRYFHEVEVRPYGHEKALGLLMPGFIRKRMLDTESSQTIFPKWLSLKLAKVQIIEFKKPRRQHS